ncbi:hypothetical protein [Saccharothrix sp. HUAS TT1]|uniref:hypothetical protein n=1 Tax=unclassified Saccharothrix TaxID=2593673 RepID=UPI00345BE2E4
MLAKLKTPKGAAAAVAIVVAAFWVLDDPNTAAAKVQGAVQALGDAAGQLIVFARTLFG